MTRLNAIAHRVLVIAGGAALIIMMLHITAEVVLRSLFDITIPGTLEFVSFYYMVIGVFAGLALVSLLHEQVVVEVFLTWMKPRGLRVFDGIGALLGAGYAGFLAYGMWLEAGSSTKYGELTAVRGFDVPIWPSRWIALIAMVIVALAALSHAIAFLRNKKGANS